MNVRTMWKTTRSAQVVRLSKADQKPPGEEQSIKRLRQLVSHGARLKWSLWAELVVGREWRPHAPRGAMSKKKK